MLRMLHFEKEGYIPGLIANSRYLELYALSFIMRSPELSFELKHGSDARRICYLRFAGKVTKNHVNF